MRRFLFIAIIISTLTGCAELTAPPPISTIATGAPTAAFSDWAGAAEIIFAKVNELRQKQGVAPLQKDERLQQIATAYARELAARGELSHFDRDRKTLADRLKSAEINDWRAAGENLARLGCDGFVAADVVKSWNLSKAHNDAMTDKIYRRSGLGYAVDAARANVYWVQVFAD